MSGLAIVQLLFFVLKSRHNIDLLRVLTRRPRGYEALWSVTYVYYAVKCRFPLSELLKDNFGQARSVCYTSLRHFCHWTCTEMSNFRFQSSVDGLGKVQTTPHLLKYQSHLVHLFWLLHSGWATRLQTAFQGLSKHSYCFSTDLFRVIHSFWN